MACIAYKLINKVPIKVTTPKEVKTTLEGGFVKIPGGSGELPPRARNTAKSISNPASSTPNIPPRTAPNIASN
jgi:hypothetical protein